jgi:S1-C subfamily serine protease
MVAIGKQAFVILGALAAAAAAGGQSRPTTMPATAAAPSVRPASVATRPARPARALAGRKQTPLVRLFATCQESVVTVVATRKHTEPATAGVPASRQAEQGAGGAATRPAAVAAGTTRPTPPPTTPPAPAVSKPSVTVVQVERGTGFIIHPDGYLLTSSHELRHGGTIQAELADRTTVPARLIARDDLLDVSLLKIDAGRKLRPLKLGRSADLMVGQDVAVLGNPFSFGISLGAGIVTGLDRSSRTDFTLLSGAIQTDAGINPGISGGPLLDMDGAVVGIATSQRRDADGIGFAVAIDDIRAAFAELVGAEMRQGFVLGLTVDMAAERAKVSAVLPGGPAAAAGVRAGDEVLAVGSAPVADGVEFHLALIGRSAGEKLALTLQRDGQVIPPVTVTLGRRPFAPALPAEAAAGLAGGLQCEHYHGHWQRLPDLARLKGATRTIVPDFTLGTHRGGEGFALEFTGLVRVPADGAYTFYADSDDGSRLYVDDQLVADNDGLHAAREKHGLLRLQAGYHPIRLTYFNAVGEEELRISYEGPGLTKQPIPPAALFHKPPAPPTTSTGPATAAEGGGK